MQTNRNEATFRHDYATALLATVKRLRTDKPRIVVPEKRGLHSRLLNAKFHATPELFIQTGGATDFTCPELSFRLHQGDFCIMPRGLPHAETPINTRTPYGVLVVGDSRGHPYLTRGHSPDNRSIRGHSTVLLPEIPDADLMAMLDNASAKLTMPRNQRTHYLRSLLEGFILLVHATLATAGQHSDTALPFLIQEARKHIRIHLSDATLNVKKIALSLGCTPDHLSRQFHRHTGLTLTKWMASERIALARHLLRASSYNIGEVAWASGFNSSSYFIRIFNQHTGQTPRAYRERHLHH